MDAGKERGRGEEERGWREGGYGRLEPVCCVSSGPLDTPSQGKTATISPFSCFERSKDKKGAYLAVPGSQDAQREWNREEEGQLNEQLRGQQRTTRTPKVSSTRHAPDVCEQRQPEGDQLPHDESGRDGRRKGGLTELLAALLNNGGDDLPRLDLAAGRLGPGESWETCQHT